MPRKNLLIAALLPLAGCTPADPAPTPPPPTEAVCPPSRGWQAWIDAMPGPGAELRLIVVGEVDVPAGMVATLRAGPTDRMMPPGQRIALDVKPGKGPTGTQQLRTEIKPALSAYREVLVGCGGETLARITEIETAH